MDDRAMAGVLRRIKRLEDGGERRRIETHGAPILRLDYTASSDLASSLALTVGSYVNVNGPQNFTIGNANSLIGVFVTLSAIALMSAGAANIVTHRLNLSDALVHRFQTGDDPVNTTFNSISGGGVWWFTGASAGTQTMRAQVYCSAATTYFCRPASTPEQEYLTIQIVEFPR